MFKEITVQLKSSFRFLACFTLLTGFLYPGLVAGLGQILFPVQAQGDLIVQKGKVVGSTLIGQAFTSPKYFWGRPSATSPTPYDAGASGGSNLGPTNPALLDAVKSRVAALRQTDPKNPGPIPLDLVTASGSGLDPHISPAGAQYQAARVARARHLPLNQVQALIAGNTQGRWLGFIGDPGVNVLKLNLALDALSAK